ncbi:hypothetical protein EXIGLDRAFT_209141 [Exidia glandulosa HHB12029]|uniref:Uncharacterized protein n=1 Tax=Exidia glandulosa HHB12029 TaxID=1314781 RepID=A0A165EKP1_EXIGL|nr:hypothetical protein EXIGLDRAFT_209141 [Exidia glandulosa HHB12029]
MAQCVPDCALPYINIEIMWCSLAPERLHVLYKGTVLVFGRPFYHGSREDWRLDFRGSATSVTGRSPTDDFGHVAISHRAHAHHRAKDARLHRSYFRYRPRRIR